ncbi:MAG: hypothetical protein Q4D30_01325 [Bacteroidales bacterium]|nr:hypothetical protein [Bacteroidales bacterium]
MKIVYNNIIPFKGYKAINLFGVLFARRGRMVGEVLLNHERIHTAQMREMLYIPFYVWYLLEWAVKLVIYRSQDKAYRAISLEREAYQNERRTRYLSERKHYCWTKKIFRA